MPHTKHKGWHKADQVKPGDPSSASAHFIVPLAGALTAFSARIYDMGQAVSRRASRQAQQDPQQDSQEDLQQDLEQQSQHEPEQSVRDSSNGSYDDPVEAGYLLDESSGGIDIREQQAPPRSPRTLLAVLACLSLLGIISAIALSFGSKYYLFPSMYSHS